MEKREPEKHGLIRFILRLIFAVIGSFSWTPPPWLNFFSAGTDAIKVKISAARVWLREYPHQHRIAILSIIVSIISIVLGYVWYVTLSQRIEFRVTGTSPSATKLEDVLKPDPVHIYFSGSAARLDQIGKPVTKGITMTPPMEGEWRWVKDSQLTFTPKNDWAVGQKYIVRFDRLLFPKHVYLEDYEYEFHSAPFTAELTDSELYQDPRNPKIKKVVATIKFSHPVDSEDFEKRITMRMADQKQGFLGLGAETYPLSVSYDKFKGEAYIHSEPVAIPMKDTSMELTIDSGVRSSRGGPSFSQKIERRIEIPGMYNFFRIKSAELSLVRNELYEPEQVLVVQMTDGVLESEIRKNLSVYLLPQDLPAMQGRPAIKNYQWHDVTIIGTEVLNVSTPLKLEPLPADKEFTTLHSFKYNVEPGKYLYIKIAKGTQSRGDYILAKDFDTIERVPEFPRELNIMYDGAVLSLSGEKKLTIVSRDIEAVRFEIGRVVPGQINHLVSQTSGQFKSPYFENYYFNQDNITERFSEVRDLKKLEHGKTQYFAFDLSDYLTPAPGSHTKRGLFFFKVESWDPVHKRPTGTRDDRLILITDLGMLVKDNVDGSHDLFVQSIYRGTPVANAKVELIGKNGLPILTETTDSDGHVRFPPLIGFEREKTPTVYVVNKGDDLSFLPYNRDERRLNLSRFDIGGVVTAGTTERLNAYLFSDRGIYRPGDEFKIGMIVKATDWTQNLTGIPLETVVTDARGLEVYKRRISLSSTGFEEIKYQTEETSPTGNYQASVYIVKDGFRHNLLGSTTVRVEEFLPDRMRITTGLSQEALEGWVSPAGLKGLVALKNLFGTPATGRRVSAMLTLSPAYPIFKSYKDYTFYDPLYAKHSFSEQLKDEQTNENGEAEFSLGLENFEKATYRLTFLAEGYEAAGGRGVSSESSVLVSPLSSLIGYKPDGDLKFISKGSARTTELIAINPQMKKIGASNLQAEIIELKYVSVLTRQSSGAYKYESVRKEMPVSKKEISIPEKGLAYSLPTDQPGDYALIIRDHEDTELNRMEFSIVGKANLTRSLEKNAELQIKLNKSDYSPGEYIEMHIKAPYIGAGLITIERDRVYSYEWFKTDTTSSVQRIRVSNNLEGNGYVHVAFVRAMDSPEIFMSPLSYGVMPFSVSRERRTNPLDIESPDLAHPGEPFRIRYKSEKPGKIVVFAVDEGILQVARYQTPDPLSHFFKKKALEVKTAQILDLILPEFKLIKELSSSAGDEYAKEALGKNLNPFKQKRDKPIAYWSGIIDVDTTQRELVYKIPDYFNGTLRVMAVAVSSDSIGVVEKKALVRGHFVLSPNVPTFVAPGDEFEVSVGIANNVEGSGKEPDIKLNLQTSEHLEIVESASRVLKIGEKREGRAMFKIKAKNLLGSANLTFTASLKDKKTSLSVDLSVRPPVPYMTTITGGYFKKGKAEAAVTRKMYPHLRTLQASASPLPLGVAQGLLNYLNKFPYGCTEQLVSQAFPAIVLRNRPEFGYSPEKVEANLERAIHILRARQNAEGAFGFWAANSHVSDFQTVYALHFLTEAKEKGYPVPSDLLSRGLAYLTLRLGRDDAASLSDFRARAYAIYILTRSGTITTNYLNTLRSQLDSRYAKQWKKDLTGIYVAATYKLLKQNLQAETLIAESKLGDKQEPDYDNYYDNLVRDSLYLYILSMHFPEHLKYISGDDILHIVTPIMQNSFNTISSAYAILSLDAYTGVGPPKLEDLSISELLAGGKHKELKLPEGWFPTVDFSDTAEKIRIASKSDFNTFYQVTQAGFDKRLPEKEIKQKLEVQREYRDEKGNVITKTKLGSEIEVHVKFRSIEGGGMHNVAIVDLLPGGFEVVLEDIPRAAEPQYEGHGDYEEGEHGGFEDGGESSLLTKSAFAAKSGWRPEYVDVREDRVVFFGAIDSNAGEFVYRIKATNKGVYAIPPIFGESMYDRTVQARGLGGKFTIEEP